MNAVRDPPSGVEELVARDEALLQAGQPTVHVTVVRATGLSFGVGSPREGHAEQVGRSLGLPCVRRTSGGTGILHQAGDLVWSVVLPRTDRRVGPDFSSAYGRLGAGVILFLADRSLDGRWADPLGRSDECCLLGHRGRTLTVGGRAIGGAAQHLTGTALLHHGVLARTLDRPLVRRIFALPEAVAEGQLTSLEELGASADPGRLADELGTALAASLGSYDGP